LWVWEEEQAGGFLEEARGLLLSDGVLALPTETYYALAVNPFDEAALARLFALKARPPEKPVLVLIAAPESLSRLAREVPEAASRLIAAFWPGPLTLILPARPDLPRRLTGGTGTIGVRQPRQPLVCRLMATLGLPLTGTSANRSGQEPLTEASEVAREFGGEVDLILDAGPCPGGLPSTIVDVSAAPPFLVRAGAISTNLLRGVIPDLRS
ncbi:MAG TPA: L-threonylcarbamoyladenylate synthase, partial [Desulfobaccales bacterium]